MIRILFFTFCFLVSYILALSMDTLKQGDILNSSTYLFSPNNIFTLGFFNLNYYEDNTTYLGIWYTNNTQQVEGDTLTGLRPVWVGNRNTPIYNHSGVLTVDAATGKLIIKHNRGGPVELYAGQTGSNTTAALLDSGNFVLREVNPGGSSNRVLWESFDFPTDTLLPGMKLGVNHQTGQTWSLMSWTSEFLPANGAFTMEWDPVGCKLMVKRRGAIYWTSGALLDKTFESVQGGKENKIQYSSDTSNNSFYHFINVTTEFEEYFTYSLKRRNVSGWLLDYKGGIYDHDRPPIARVDLCYGYNIRGVDETTNASISGGCELWKQPKCGSRRLKFELRSGSFTTKDNLFVGGTSFEDNSSFGFSDCREKCWNDCNCVRFDDYGACTILRGKNLKFNQDRSGATVSSYVLITEPQHRKKWIWGIIAAVVSLVLLVLVLLCYRRRNIKRKEKDFLESMTTDEYRDPNVPENDACRSHEIKALSFASIVAATNSFSQENKLGQGGFGPVYKGKLREGQEIAVKRLSRTSGQGLQELKNELILIAKVQHVNLVKLLGYCIHGHEKMLIYEYMPNKSLDFFLFDQTKRGQLTWQRRFNIIEGIGQGLLYLHQYSRLRIVHRDLKASNILLDESMTPKISDFGMAKIFKQHLSEANTIRIVGTYGYMAPEYAMGGIFSVKSDVYSYGVLLLEIVCGRKNNSFYHIEGPLNLVGYAWELWSKGAALELMDPTLTDSSNLPEVLRCIQLGLLCVEDSAIDRPSMSDIISFLMDETTTLPVPKKPSFVTNSTVFKEDSSKRKLENLSLNGLSISVMDGR